jgi:hypothetical protein
MNDINYLSANYYSLISKLHNSNTCWYVSAADDLSWINDWEGKLPFEKPNLFVCTDIGYINGRETNSFHWPNIEENNINITKKLGDLFECTETQSFSLPFAEGLSVKTKYFELILLGCFNEDFYAFCLGNNITITNFRINSHHDRFVYEKRLDFQKLGVKNIWAECFNYLIPESHYHKFMFPESCGLLGTPIIDDTRPCIMISKSVKNCENAFSPVGLVHKNMKFGYEDSSRNFQIDCLYDYLHYDTGVAKMNGKWGCIDKEGNIIIEFIYESIGRRDIGACGWIDIDKAILNGKTLTISGTQKDYDDWANSQPIDRLDIYSGGNKISTEEAKYIDRFREYKIIDIGCGTGHRTFPKYIGEGIEFIGFEKFEHLWSASKYYDRIIIGDFAKHNFIKLFEDSKDNQKKRVAFLLGGVVNGLIEGYYRKTAWENISTLLKNKQVEYVLFDTLGHFEWFNKTLTGRQVQLMPMLPWQYFYSDKELYNIFDTLGMECVETKKEKIYGMDKILYLLKATNPVEKSEPEIINEADDADDDYAYYKGQYEEDDNEDD